MGSVRWHHSDPRGLAAAVTSAFARARQGEWSVDEPSRADFRALLLSVWGTSANLGTTPVTPPNESGDVAISIAGGASADRRAWQDALGFGALTLIAGPGKGDPRKVFADGAIAGDITIRTEGGSPASGTDAGLPWLAAGAIAGLWLVGVGLVGYATAWMHSQDVELANNQLATNHKQQALASSLAAAADVVDRHLQREAEAQSTIPWDAQELRLFDALVGNIKEASGWTPPPLETVKSGNGLVDAFGRAVRDVGAGVRTGASWLPLALLAVVVWKLS